jgi:hypothetical protein
MHVRHFPDLPSGEITIEGTSTTKHCTTRKHNELEKKEEKRALFKNRISAATEKEEGIRETTENKTRSFGEGWGKECTYSIAFQSLPRPAIWRDHH